MPPHLIDLSDHYFAGLAVPRPDDLVFAPDLSTLADARQTLAGVDFDVRGFIEVSSAVLKRSEPSYRESVEGIPIHQRGRRLHFLHAAVMPEADGTQIGSYVVHYADGQQQEILIVYGQDVVAWDLDPPRTNSPPVVAWKGRNRVCVCVQLFKTTWDNPQPDVEIETLDFTSKMAQAAPFLVAITAEP